MGVRPPVVFYNRANEAAALLKPGDFDWDAIFGRGRAVVPQRRPVRVAVGDDRRSHHRGACRRRGRPASSCPFDLNYREKLWKAQGALDKAQSIFKRIVENVDVLVGNEEDLQKALGVAGPEAGKGSALDTARVLRHDHRVVEQYPNVKVVATTLREVHSTNRHTGRPWPGSTASRSSRRRRNSTCSIASAAATASRRA